MTAPRILVSGPASGSGKTTVATLLILLLRRRGLTVQPFKVGPDYIDGSYHEAVSGRVCRTLDLWMGGEADVRREFARGMQGADVGVVEGVMGLLDSGSPDGVDASSARVAAELSAPVVLVVDVARMAESAAAVVAGFQDLAGQGPHSIQAVVLNRVGGSRHAALVTAAIRKATGIPTLAALPDRPDLSLPERHLGLVPAHEDAGLPGRLQELAGVFQSAVDPTVLKGLLRAGDRAVESPDLGLDRPLRTIPVAVARDAAFHFYYQANLELLEELGAELQYFSPLVGQPIPPDARFLYVGGGFPEQFVPTFQRLREAHERYRQRIRGGLVTVAECGGYLWLARTLSASTGEPVPMLGVVPADMALRPHLQGFGYRILEAAPGGPFPAGARFRGHAFHHAQLVRGEIARPAWIERDGAGRTGEDGALGRTWAAGFLHAYWRSNPKALRAMLGRAHAQPLDDAD